MNQPLNTVAVIALGSNLQNPAEQVKAALAALGAHRSIKLEKSSSLYLTTPVGYADQPDFINAVCLVNTSLDADALLNVLHGIEQQFGRERSFRNAPRTLDLDIIDYGHQLSDNPRLTLPHPRAHERAFVMVPLAEIAPGYPIGKHGTAAELATALGNSGIEQYRF